MAETELPVVTVHGSRSTMSPPSSGSNNGVSTFVMTGGGSRKVLSPTSTSAAEENPLVTADTGDGGGGREFTVSPLKQNQLEELEVKELGYKQELVREMTSFANFAISFSILSALTGITQLFGYGLITGGPVVIIWSWFIVAFFSCLVSLSLAEICSTYPTAGGVYYWAFQLAPDGWKAFFSWMTAWFSILGQLCILAAADMGLASATMAFFNLTSGVTATPNHLIGFYAGLLVIHGAMNFSPVKWLSHLNTLAAAINIGAILIISIWLWCGSPQLNDKDWVVTYFHNETGWGDGYAVMIGALFAQWTFTGFEASAAMSEETHNARLTAPVGIFMAVVVSFPAGLILIFALICAIQDYEGAITSATGNAVAQIFVDAVGHKAGIFLLFLVLMTQFCCGQGCVTSCSRAIYALARDGGFPWSKTFVKLTPQGLPYAAIIFCVIFCFCLGLPYLGNPTAFAALTSLATIGVYISYGVPIALRVYRGRDFELSVFNLGRFGVIIGIAGCMWVMLITILFVLPQLNPVVAQNMNYACVLVGAVFIGALMAWICGVRHSFKGPPIAVPVAKRQSTRRLL